MIILFFVCFTGVWNAEVEDVVVAARAATAAVAVELLLLLLLLELIAAAAGGCPPRKEPPWLLSTRRGGLWGDTTGLADEFNDAGGWSLNDNNLFLEHGESPNF